MEANAIAQLKESARVKLLLADTGSGSIVRAARAIVSAFRGGGTLFIMGNGGSAADAQHIATEFISLKMDRKALPAIALTTDTSLLSAIGNDTGFDSVFSRQLEGLAKHKEDVVLAISTSGNSRNVLQAVLFAKKHKLKTIGLTGNRGALKDKVDFPIVVPSSDTQRIQEAHITIGHILYDITDKEFFS